MSWWGPSPIESEIARATSSSIPSGDQDLALNLEICDTVRSKQATPKDTLRALRKRLYDTNPNVQILALHLLDLLVKNGGAHFFEEFAAKEFVDAYVAELLSLHNQQRNFEVLGLMLEYFQTWARASASKPEAQYLQEKYTELKRRKDIEFPEPGPEGDISSSFLESATAPEWTDSDTCMKSGQPFSFYNRKHHCRNCGGVFLQEYCSNFAPLPHFGINTPVRICDDCNIKVTRKSQPTRRNPDSAAKSSVSASVRGVASNNRDIGSRFRQDLEEAINLSLKAQPQQSARPPAPTGSARVEDEELDEDVRQAIEASLAELRAPNGQLPNGQPNGYSAVSSAAPNAAAYAVASEPQPPAPAIPPKDREAIESYVNLVQTSEPREAIYNVRLTELNRRAIELQPRVISELKISTSKLGTLEDLNGKLLAVACYYDRLLEAELNPGQFAPPEPLHATAFATSTGTGNTSYYQGLSHVSPQPAETGTMHYPDAPASVSEQSHQPADDEHAQQHEALESANRWNPSEETEAPIEVTAKEPEPEPVLIEL